ncbi:glycosyltransferase [Altererythrobacter sp. Z27]|uniref:glycosyltransferase n=1 Tax=Altererythrobacter sp. Z27 TaxID=3461147 RepID=UPI0040442DEB
MDERVADLRPAVSDPTYVGPDRRAFGLRRDLAYWRKRAQRRNLIFAASLAFASLWMLISVWLSLPWLSDLGNLSHPVLAMVVLTFIAYVPGFMNAFLLGSLALRPNSLKEAPEGWPGISVLVAAYQEEDLIAATLRNLSELTYPGQLEVIVIDDGSKDATFSVANACVEMFAATDNYSLRVERMVKNSGKARALNHGLNIASHELVITIDADTLLEKGSITAMVAHLYASPPQTAAIAGSVLVANTMESWITKAQQWDYFHGIAAVKRMQGNYNGTLVAQGAFSLYRRSALVQAGGWPDTVGEDIVLTWSLLRRNYIVRHAEDAIAWTYAPATLNELSKQRKRWARGMIEALAIHKRLLGKRRLSTMFIYWNLMFISIDLAFTLAFIPGLLLALFGIFWLAGPITLLVLPLAALWNIVIYRIQTRMLRREGIEMEKSWWGFILYAFIYPFVMQPVSVWGYAAELFGGKKNWD